MDLKKGDRVRYADDFVAHTPGASHGFWAQRRGTLVSIRDISTTEVKVYCAEVIWDDRHPVAAPVRLSSLSPAEAK